MSGKLVVALNALINPANAGGSESSALSILINFRDAPQSDIDMHVTALPPFAPAISAIRADPSRVIEWPWKEFTVVSSAPKPSWAIAARKRLGNSSAGRAFDGIFRALNQRAFLKTQPSRSDIDALLDKSGIDVVHFTYPVSWPTRRPFIFEPHDVQQYHFPEFFDADTLAWRHATYTAGVRNAALTVCGSYWTKRDIMRHFGVGADRIAVVPRSSTMGRAKLTEEQVLKLAKDNNLIAPFMYYPAMTFRHKNHLRLLEAMALLRDRDGLKVQLVCTGRPHKPFQPTINEAVSRLGLQDQVRFLGKVSEELLAVCYRQARFIVFPSLLEGHSQALLESLYHRKPIVAASQSSVPETVGEAALFFDALDVEAIAAAVRQGWTDDAVLEQMQARIGPSFERYRWDRALVTLTACYKYAAGRPLSAEERDALDRALLEHEPEPLG